MEYISLFKQSIDQKKSQILAEAFTAKFGDAEPTKENIEISIDSNKREWYAFNGKTFGYIDQGWVGLTHTYKLWFVFQENEGIDQEIANQKAREREAKLKEERRQNKLWEAVYNEIVPIFNSDSKDHKPTLIVNRLRELGFKLEMGIN